MTTLHDQWTALYATGRVRWMPGMMTERGRIVRLQGPQFCEVYSADASCGLRINEPAASLVPDFSYPATIGCLLHQAREAWDDKGLTVVGEFVPPFAPSWRVMGGDHHGAGFQRLAMIGHDSEPAAILAAIAAAPPKVQP
jgi:hypothetical protein